MTAAEKFRRLLQKDTRYHPEAYNFVYEALDHTLKHIVQTQERSHHVSGGQLLEGIRQLSIEQFGCLARPILECWGIRSTEDVGRIVFNLVEHDLMGKQESDSLEDFRGVYEFDEVFDLAPLFHYSGEDGDWKATYVTRSQLSRMRS